MGGPTNILHAATKLAVPPRCDNWTATVNLRPTARLRGPYLLFAITTCVTLSEGTCATVA
jgi:hypothetical protein